MLFVVTMRIGVIGVGVMGADHARKLDAQVAGAAVTAIADFDEQKAKAVAAEMRAATVAADSFELIGSADVDAVVIASRDSTHAELALAAIAAGKPVMCEKPLAPTVEQSARVAAAERVTVGSGTPLVSVGFMRRFDPGY